MITNETFDQQVQDFWASHVSSPVQLQRGQIETKDLRDGIISAAKIQANVIDATKINVSQLSAISADLGTITAGTVTGVLFRTAASGKRIELSSAVVDHLYFIAADEGGAGSVSIYSTYGIAVTGGSDGVQIGGTGDKVGMLGAAPTAVQTVTGSRGGNAALADLLTKLQTKGLIADGTT